MTPLLSIFRLPVAGRRPMRLPAVLFVILLATLGGCDRPPTFEVGTLDWHDGEGYRWAEVTPPGSGEPGFEVLRPEWTGVDFENALTEDQIVENRNLLNGSGVAIGDVTGNGFPDLYFARLHGPNVLYENLGGYEFRDITEGSGVALPDQFSTGATFADLNGNGRLDLVVTSNDAPNRLFWNEGSGRFTEAEGALEADRNYGSASIAVGDLTGNGSLDLYITNYKVRTARDIFPYENQFRFIVEQVDGEHRITERFQEHYELELRDNLILWFEVGEPDLLYLNRGDGTFEWVPLDSGVLKEADGTPITEAPKDWGLHVKIHDLNGNGLPDLYVANDFETPDRIWMNEGDGTFRALEPHGIRKLSLSSMAVDFTDLTRNGHTDFMVVEMLSRRHDFRIRQMGTSSPSPQPIGATENRPMYMGNTLYLNRGDGSWAEIAEYAGVRRSEWSWSVIFLDMTLDGYEDALVATGHFYDVQDSDVNAVIQNRLSSGQIDPERMMLLFPPLRTPNVAFRNRGDLTFEDVGEAWGFTEDDVSHGMALGDLNNTGMPDLVINRIGEPARIFRNRIDRPRVGVRLRGVAPNTGAVGAKIRFLGGPVEQSKEVVAGGTYLSGSQPHQVFAPGDEPGPFTVEVRWPDGSFSRLEGVEADRIYEIDQESMSRVTAEDGVLEGMWAELRDAAPAGGTWFEDRSDALDHLHHEAPFDDFDRQPLLPMRLSQEGPGTAWFDWTGNGLDDLFVGSGRGGALAFFENRGGTLQPASLSPVTDEEASLDQTGIVAFEGAGGVRHLLVGLSGFEGAAGVGDASEVRHYRDDGTGVELVETLEIPETAVGPLAVADWTGDGTLDLFVGGRVTPGRYPEPTPSFLYRNVDGSFQRDDAASEALAGVGQVTGALFADLTGDGRAELALATDWGPVRVFAFDEGRPVERTEALGLDAWTGWWRGISAGDFTGDGRLDLVVTNHGENFHTRTLTDRPPRLYFADVVGDGSLDLIEGYHDPKLEFWVPRRGPSILAASMPHLLNRNRTYAEFAVRDLDEIVGPTFETFEYVEASTMEHMLLLNRGDHFEVRPLPVKAQFAPAFAPVVGDFTGDGHLDLFLSQNFFAYELETPRSDAGRSLLLAGDGSGRLEPVPGHESGLVVWGEQRGAAAADWTGDGRLDLVVSQNGTWTRAFENRGAAPGVRVRLEGPPANPRGIGAVVRPLDGAGEAGPARAVTAGSGYWSQDSPVTVVTVPSGAVTEVQVRWPDGTESVVSVPQGATEVTVAYGGSGS
jgi:enediyne biosynthesis protein E4